MDKEKTPLEREQTTLRMPEDLKVKLQEKAEKRGISFNELIMIIFDEYLQD